MCGLVGMAGSIGLKEEKAFKLLLQLDTIRGPHSTGVFSVSTVGYDLDKVVGTPWDLYDTVKFGKTMNRSMELLLGHNRWATSGAVTKRNAHPFLFEGKLCGAHNGTLKTRHLLDDNKDFVVDSENLYHHMSIHGLAETVNKLDGSYALTWFNFEDNTMNFLRNSERDLNYCYSKDGKTIFWASEAWMLTVALSKEGIEFDKTVPFEEMHHYKVPLLSKDIGKPTVKKYEEYVAPAVNYNNTWYNRNYYKGANVEKKERPSVDERLQSKVGTVVTFTGGVGCHSNINSYILTKCKYDIELPVKIFPEYNSKLWESLSDGKKVFTGKVKSVNTQGKGYLLIDLRTVNDISYISNDFYDDEDEPDVEEYLPTYNNLLIPYKDWEAKTHVGCSWCTSPVHSNEADELVWIDSNTFVCGSCAENDEVKEILVK